MRGVTHPTSVWRDAGRGRGAGFTLVEVMVVVAIMGIVSLSIVPAIGSMTQARRAAAVQEVTRRFQVARARALATGKPHGVEVLVGAGTVRSMVIETVGGTPEGVMLATGVRDAGVKLSVLISGVSVTGLTNPNTAGGATTAVVWFAHDGTYQCRTSTGTVVGSAGSDAVVTVSGGSTVRVSPTGLVTGSIVE